MSAESESGCRAEVTDDLVRLTGTNFGAVFRKIEDRWIESLEAAGLPAGLVQALRLAGTDPARVAHPVFQEVHLHGEMAGPSLCLLLTGLSFDHHFSAAVSLSSEDDGRSVLVDFDVADRCRSQIESLAATYLLGLTSSALLEATPERITWSVESPAAGRLELTAGPGTLLTMAEAGRQATRVQILASLQLGTFTHRLRYGWRWTTAAGLTR